MRRDRERRLTRRERRNVWLVGSIAGVAIVVAGVLAVVGVFKLSLADLFGEAAAPTPTLTPRTDAVLFVATDSNAAKAAAEDPRFDALAAVPQPRWLAGWTTVESVEDDTRRYVDAAAAAGAIPMLVLYEIPERDCGLSVGGFTVDEYLPWVDGVVRGLGADSDAIVILEPDALPMLDTCPNPDVRTELLREAATRLATTGADVYIDAGHSGWHSPEEMADRLVEVGVAEVRGFSTNVSNFRPTEDEIEYAERIRARLAELGIPDAHYVVDTSRNGAPVENGDVCNPLTARLGEEPQLFTGGGLDAYLWVKAPGEPDGPCNGSTPGQLFWAEGALRLMGELD
ncbi:glycoside hydrolase family 6 protein [Microbacterium sp. GXF7504]